MSILTSVLSGVNGALAMAQTFLTQPYVAGIRIACDKYQEVMDNDVSEQVIIDASKGKGYQTDNICPKPSRWVMSGYLEASPAEISGLSPILQPSLFAQKAVLRKARESRQLVDFSPLYKEGMTNLLTGGIKVAIEHLDFDTKAETSNKVPVNITVKLVPVLSINAPSGMPTGTDNPAAPASDMGVVAAVKGSLSLKGIFP